MLGVVLPVGMGWGQGVPLLYECKLVDWDKVKGQDENS